MAAREGLDDAMLVAYRFGPLWTAGKPWLDSLYKLQIGPRQIEFQRWTVSDVKLGLDEGADRILVAEAGTLPFDRRSSDPSTHPGRVRPHGPGYDDWPPDLQHRFRFVGRR